MIVAITGPSGSGKSTISKMLASKHENGVHLSLDDYWVTNNDRKFFFNKSRMYELPDGYNGKELARKAWELSANDVFIEGLHVMAYPEVRKLIRIHFYLDVSWEISVQRRLARQRPSDGISTKVWMELGKDFNELNVGYQRDLKDTVVLDGIKSPDILVEEISQILLDLRK